MRLCAKLLQFLGCSCAAPNSARPEQTTLLQRGIVGLITGFYSVG